MTRLCRLMDSPLGLELSRLAVGVFLLRHPLGALGCERYWRMAERTTTDGQMPSARVRVFKASFSDFGRRTVTVGLLLMFCKGRHQTTMYDTHEIEIFTLV